MSKSRRIGAIMAMAAAAAVTSAAPAVAAPPGGPQPVSSWLRAVKAHSDSWVDIYWRTSGPICDVKVAVAGRGVAVSYRGHRRFATLSRGSVLRPSRPDFTAISVDPDFARSGIARLKTGIAFNNCTRHARTQYRTFMLTLPVQRNHNWPGHSLPGQPGGPVHPGVPVQPGNGQPHPAGSPSPVSSPTPSPVTTSPAPAVSPPSSVSPPTSASPAAAPSSATTPAPATSLPAPAATATSLPAPAMSSRPVGGQAH